TPVGFEPFRHIRRKFDQRRAPPVRILSERDEFAGTRRWVNTAAAQLSHASIFPIAVTTNGGTCDQNRWQVPRRNENAHERSALYFSASRSESRPALNLTICAVTSRCMEVFRSVIRGRDLAPQRRAKDTTPVHWGCKGRDSVRLRWIPGFAHRW